tara:strand:+ start:7642 stop:8664 length:1023 start_codon:yes stop_codon:yes gene_type:complete
MANKSVYQEYNLDALIHFGLKDEPMFGLITSNQIDDVLITQDVTTYERMKDILSGATLTSTNFQSYKRAFILPKCPISQDRIKAACKEHKITITNDYEAADFVITHDDFYEKFQHGEKIKTQTVMYHLWNYEAMDSSNNRIRMVENHDKSVIYDTKWEEHTNSYNCNTTDSLMDEWGLPGLAVNLAYLIETGQLQTLDSETLLHSSANLIDLTEELVGELKSWVDSSDSDNLSLAGKILPTINYTKHPHLVWDLAQKIGGRMYNFNRDKDVQYWIEAASINEFYHMSAQDVVLKFKEEEILDKKSFRFLEKIIRQEISIHNRELYTFKVSVKKEFQKYLI